MGRFKRVIDEAKQRHYLKEELIGESYPGPVSVDAFRRYFCLLTGGCKWGPKHQDHFVFDGYVRFCWKCRSTWSNPSSTEHLREWSKLASWMEPVERRVRKKHVEQLNRIRGE